MNITEALSWQTANWPTAATAAADYAIFINANSTPYLSSTAGQTSATVTYDDANPGYVFLIRPTDGTNYGPAQTIVRANTPLNNRAWIRDYIRKSINDRLDIINVSRKLLVTDDELNGYINDAIREYTLMFPLEKDYTITLIAGGERGGARDYQLPVDFQRVVTARYNQANSNLQLFLREEPFKGGETTATSWVGYPKLGILQPPIGGRYYPGHYDIYEGSIHLDFDPLGNGDTITLRYVAAFPYPTDDVTPLSIPEDDLKMILLHIEANCWKEIEGKDVSLSRFDRGASGNARRDDMPTEKMSTRLFNAWKQWIDTRRSLRPKTYRLVRR